jgi:hypothetical protein
MLSSTRLGLEPPADASTELLRERSPAITQAVMQTLSPAVRGSSDADTPRHWISARPGESARPTLARLRSLGSQRSAGSLNRNRPVPGAMPRTADHRDTSLNQSDFIPQSAPQRQRQQQTSITSEFRAIDLRPKATVFQTAHNGIQIPLGNPRFKHISSS